MTTKSEALRLADWLLDNVAHINHAEAAAELRRLEAANAELLDALKQSERALSAVAKDDPTFQLARLGLRCARAAIAKHGGAE